MFFLPVSNIIRHVVLGDVRNGGMAQGAPGMDALQGAEGDQERRDHGVVLQGAHASSSLEVTGRPRPRTTTPRHECCTQKRVAMSCTEIDRMPVSKLSRLLARAATMSTYTQAIYMVYM